MGLRFRKSVRILPGLRLNFGERGVSATIGRPGANVNVSKRGVRGTVGVPGSGVSYSEQIIGRRKRARAAEPELDAPAEPGLIGRALGLLLGRR